MYNFLICNYYIYVNIVGNVILYMQEISFNN